MDRSDWDKTGYDIMKRVLMTNLYLSKYTGSELHVLELARQFEKRGYEVTIAVFQKAHPLLEQADTICVVDCLQEELEIHDYEIIFVQHYPVFDFLCAKYDLTYKKLVVSKLSITSELEHLPICVKDADLILCISDECANGICDHDVEQEKVEVFKNSVGDEFFEKADFEKCDRQLKNIAVVSNHVVPELLELPRILGDAYRIDYIGAEFSPRLVDADLLKEYDLVITIGRTVQQCFAVGVPVYVYDRFGGPGYINEVNFMLAEKNNYSGRGGFGQKTAIELAEDIQENYDKNCLYLEKLYSCAKEKYSYEMNFDRVYQKLIKTGCSKKKSLNYYAELEKARVLLYSQCVPGALFSEVYVSQMYMDYGEGFNEIDSIKWYATSNYVISKKIKTDKKINCLRFDPCNVPAECIIDEICINGKVREEFSQRIEIFMNFDPQMVIELTDEEKNFDELCVEVKYKFKAFSWQDTLSMYEKKVETLENRIEALREYYKFTSKNILRRGLQFFKRMIKHIEDNYEKRKKHS